VYWKVTPDASETVGTGEFTRDITSDQLGGFWDEIPPTRGCVEFGKSEEFGENKHRSRF